MAAFQNLRLEAGETYRASLYSTFSPGNAASAVFSIKYHTGTEWVDFNTVEMTGDSWQQFEIDFTVEEGKDSIQFSIWRWAQNDFYVDDCYLGIKPAAAPVRNRTDKSPRTQLYLNPLNEVLYINTADNTTPAEIDVYNLNGVLVKRVRQQSTISVAGLSSGIYTVVAGDKTLTFYKQ